MPSSAEMEDGMPSWGVAFGFQSILEDEEHLSPVFDKEDGLQPSCSEWAA